MDTLICLVQIEPKNGLEAEKVKKGYWQCGPHPPTSSSNLIHHPSPSKFTPFCLEGLVHILLLVRIPWLFCVRGMLKVFVGKNCRICQLYWCCHKSNCSKTRRICQLYWCFHKSICSKTSRICQLYWCFHMWTCSKTRRICQLYWCFHKSICSKTRRRDLRNCPQHPKRDLSKGDTVWWALQNCMFFGGQWAFGGQLQKKPQKLSWQACIYLRNACD